MLWAALFSAFAASVGVLAEEYSNPIRQGPDPFVVYDNDTRAYYFLATPVDQLYITTAPTLNKLKTAERVTVYQDAAMQDKRSVWAPELHQLDGKWYLYYTFESMSYVLEGGASPMGPYGPPIQLTTDYGIDGTVLKVKDAPYFVWSCHRGQARSGTDEQSLCIAPLETPTKIDMSKVGVISQPRAEWEVQGRAINEGPAPLYWDNEIYLVFSASFCFSPDYSLGLLHLVGEDPLAPESWEKRPSPVLTGANGLTSTGHNAIFTSPDGTEVWNVFHTSDKPAGSCGDDRQTFAMKIDVSHFKEQGPIFGEVQAPGPMMQGPSGEDGEPLAPTPVPYQTGSTSQLTRTSSTDAVPPGISPPASSFNGKPQSSRVPPPVLQAVSSESSTTSASGYSTGPTKRCAAATGAPKKKRSKK